MLFRSASVPVQYQIKDIVAWARKHANPNELLERIATREVVRHLVSVDFFEFMSTGRRSAAEAAAIALLVPILDERIERAGLRRLLDDVELPLSAVLGEMQALGIRLDVTYLTSMAEEVRGRMEALRRDIVGHAGEEFNLNSPQQLRAILYDKLGLSPGKKTPTGQPSTDASVLEKLRDRKSTRLNSSH